MLCSACYAALTTDIEGRMCWNDSHPQDLVHHPTSDDFEQAVVGKCHICLTLAYQWEHKFKLRLSFPKHVNKGITHRSGEKVTSRHFTRFYLSRGERSFTPGPWYPISEKSFFITFYLDETFKEAIMTNEIRNQILLTFVANPYPEFERSIKLSQLQRVYREAIEITLRLGVSYLWIDSLCICQDDKQDWNEEASKMFDIYRNAAFNIGATGASDGDGQCFVNHNVDLLHPCLFNMVLENKASKKPRLRDRLFRRKNKTEDTEPPASQETTWHVVDETFWTGRLYQQPLNQRAWVLQERLISPRMIHFGADQVYWECHEHHACEAYPKGPQAMHELRARKAVHPDVIQEVLATQLEESRKRRRGISLTPTSDSPPREWALFGWSDIVAEYNKLDLTLPKDKLIALSGLAKQMQPSIQDQYVAGLWRSAMLMGLLWRINHRERSREGKGVAKRLKGAAPTWSWASVQGNTHVFMVPDGKLKGLGFEIHIDIQNIALNPIHDEYGALNLSPLQIKGQLWPAAFLSDNMRNAYRWKYSKGQHYQDPDVRFPFFDLGSGALTGGWGEIDCTPDTAMEPGDLDVTANMHIMPIVSVKFPGNDQHAKSMTQGLILRKIEGDGGYAQYERFGYFQHSENEDFLHLARKVGEGIWQVIEIV
ncbi:hypothetical protein SAPIO_CDS1637 [Scedosporium apiospermum]|uniref:Heterokaryon incompatibility domain-containing protein n=1 Tax=Pseudallescheria apiosperma TaxID=563466 RepID=A0A084GEQ9_PSEDA|nr:uncharacterized protein SAPIO_CDS1637 [Scedosporium apiospermum]KEZ45821.1 hypothetical protein SAPIO_CDS1637 [Scedosporium apiospermum]